MSDVLHSGLQDKLKLFKEHFINTLAGKRVKTFTMHDSLNVFEEPLENCSDDPLTGFFRDGCCNTSSEDMGSHTICIQATQQFLEYSRFKGNDLSTPVPEFEFPGVKPGDSWCLCAARWWEAYNEGMAPRVFLKRTHIRALEIVPMEILRDYALDLN